MLDVIHYKKSPFTEVQEKLPFPQDHSRNSSHESNI